jgi:AraC-like DNA-binding protein
VSTGPQISEDVHTRSSELQCPDAADGIISRLAVLSRRTALETAGTREARCAQCIERRDLIRRWLRLPLARKQEDLKLYLERGRVSIEGSRFDGLSAAHYLGLVPAYAGCTARRLFQFGLVAAQGALRAEPLATGPPHARRAASAVQTVLARHGDVQLCLKILSNEMGVSANRLALLFAKVTGVSFRQYARSVRLTVAAAMLSAPGAGITRVAQALGYSAPTNFVRDFRTGLLMCPTAFRSACTQASFIWRCPLDLTEMPPPLPPPFRGSTRPFIAAEELPLENCKWARVEGESPVVRPPIASQSR